jgi:hypothetical protein
VNPITSLTFLESVDLHRYSEYGVLVITKAAAPFGTQKEEMKFREMLQEHLKEMRESRKRMKALDARIRRADTRSRHAMDEAWAALKNVQRAL